MSRTRAPRRAAGARRLPRESCEAFLRAVSDAELDGLIRRLREMVPPDERTAAGPGAGERCPADGDEAATLAWLEAVLAGIRREKGDG